MCPHHSDSDQMSERSQVLQGSLLEIVPQMSLSFGPVMCPHHSDQMSQRSLGSLCSIVNTLIVNGNGPAKGQTDKVTYTGHLHLQYILEWGSF